MQLPITQKPAALWYYIRRYPGVTGTVLVILSVFAATLLMGLGWETIAAAGTGALIMLVIWKYDAREFRRLKQRGIERGQLNKFGEVLSFTRVPTPGSSMFEELKKTANVNPDQITAIRMQTCSFSNSYLHNFLKSISPRGLKENAYFELVGFGTKEDKEQLQKTVDRRLVLRDSEGSTEGKIMDRHWNVIQTQDQTFVWFEPYHNENHAHYIPSQGGFLMKIPPEKEQDTHLRFEEGISMTTRHENQKTSVTVRPKSINVVARILGRIIEGISSRHSHKTNSSVLQDEDSEFEVTRLRNLCMIVPGPHGSHNCVEPERRKITDLRDLRNQRLTMEIALDAELFPRKELSSTVLKQIVAKHESHQPEGKRPKAIIFHVRGGLESRLRKRLIQCLSDMLQADNDANHGLSIFIVGKPSIKSDEVKMRLDKRVGKGEVSDEQMKDVLKTWNAHSAEK